MLIPYTELCEEILQSISKDWVISKVSDTESHPEIDECTAQTMSKIKSGELVIEYGEESQSVYLKSKDEIDFQQGETENE
jgi:uncharacterized protein YheU (UPF0270 family)